VKEATTTQLPDCRYVSVPLFTLVAVLGLMVLAGWAWDFPALRSLGPSDYVMKPFTAVMLLVATTLGFFQAFAKSGWLRLRTALAGVLFVLATLFAFENAVQTRFGLERLLFPETVARYDTRFGGLMALAVCVAFMFIAASTFAAVRSRPDTGAWLLAAPGAIGTLGVIGYGYEVPALYESAAFAPIALHTAASLVMLSIALWCSIQHNRLLQVFTSDTPHARMLRRIGPAIVLVPLVLGIVQTRMGKLEAVPPSVANAIGTLLEIIVLGALLVFNLVSVYREQRLRAAAEADREDFMLRLADNEERMRMAFAAGSMGWWEYDITTRQGRASPQVNLLLGVSEERATDTIALVRRCIHPDDRERWWRHFQHSIQELGDYRIEYRVVHPDNSVRWLASRGRVLANAKGQPARLVSVVVDITEVRRAEEAVRESERKFRRIFETANEGIWVLDADSRVTMVNARLAEMLGYSREEMLGRTKTDFVFSPEDREVAREQFELRKQNFAGFFEVRLRHRGGHAVWAQFSATPVFEDGKFAGVLDMIADINERKNAEAELARAQEQLRQHAITLEQRVEERTAQLRDTIAQLEAFSYSITHDMRGPLRAMSGFAGILAQEYGPKLDADAHEYLDRMTGAAARLDALIQDVLNYSRISKGDLPIQSVDVCALIHDIVNQYPDLAVNRQFIALNCGEHHVMANLAALTQVISNLIGNALKFVPAGQSPHVRVESEVRGDRLRLWVKDKGVGIPPEYQNKIWGPFQRLHKVEEFPGTGIGLAIVKKAMERMSGAVGVESELGEGARFWIELPLAPVAAHHVVS
jgi:PAS domain S-box-containing protein